MRTGVLDKNAYTMRIAQANPVQLVVINFELIIDALDGVLEACRLEDGSASTMFCRHLDRAKNGVQQLIDALDFTIGLSHDFYEIYKYSYKLLNEAYFSLKPEPAKEVLELMNILLEGWRDAEKQNISEGQKDNTSPHVYAGLTYNRSGLAEFVDEDEGRGFKA